MVTIETDDEFGEVGRRIRRHCSMTTRRFRQMRPSASRCGWCRLRLRCKRSVVAEAYSLLRAMSSGHSGVTTWHSEEGRELEALCMMARQHPAGREMSEGAAHGDGRHRV